LKDEYQDDPDLSIHLETAKVDLRRYFNEIYLFKPSELSESHHIPLSSSATFSSISSSSQATASITASESPKKNFTPRFQCKRAARDELLEFWNLQQEDFETCDPLQWWLGRRAQFPNLYRLSRDIFPLPGKFYFIGLDISY
jgi:hAT family C-terminal dimerisation region